jgi:hypothetical protein
LPEWAANIPNSNRQTGRILDARLEYGRPGLAEARRVVLCAAVVGGAGRLFKAEVALADWLDQGRAIENACHCAGSLLTVFRRERIAKQRWSNGLDGPGPLAQRAFDCIGEPHRDSACARQLEP